MAEKIGKLLTCDRCGAETFVAKTGESETDGGFTRWDNYEEAEGWHNERVDGMWMKLCPTCHKRFSDLCKTYLEEGEG